MSRLPELSGFCDCHVAVTGYVAQGTVPLGPLRYLIKFS